MTIDEAGFVLARLLMERGCDPSMIDQVDAVLCEDGRSVMAFCYIRGNRDEPFPVCFDLTSGPFDKARCEEAFLPRRHTWMH